MKCSWGPKVCFESARRTRGSGHRIVKEGFTRKRVAVAKKVGCLRKEILAIAPDKLHCGDVLHCGAATLSIAENNAPVALTLFLKIAIADQKSQC